MKIRKAIKKDCGDSNLPRKFERWKKDHHESIGELVYSAFHPLDRSFFENEVAYIVFIEDEDGFFGAEAGRMDADDEMKEHYSEAKKTMRPDGFLSMSIFLIESSTGKRSDYGLEITELGNDRTDSTLWILIEDARYAKDVQVEIFARLNKVE